MYGRPLLTSVCLSQRASPRSLAVLSSNFLGVFLHAIRSNESEEEVVLVKVERAVLQ